MKAKNSSRTSWGGEIFRPIDLLRFPLAVAVIFIHYNPYTISLSTATFSVFTTEGVYNILAITMSHVIASVAVPTFFMISGFLYFNNFPNWSWYGYKKKINRRFRTLIIPYLSWNALVFVSSVILMTIKTVLINNNSYGMVIEYIKGMWLRCFYNYREWELGNVLGSTTYMTAPIDIPLWFLRDLIVMIILTPLIYYFMKKTNIWVVLFLFIAYVTNIWLPTPGFSITAFFFFCLGAYFAINRINLMDFSRRYCFIFIPLSVILFILCVYFDGTYLGPNLLKLYIVATVFVLFSLSSWIVEKYNIKALTLLVNSCFFVYASHTVFILGIAGKILHTMIPGESAIKECVCLLLTPVLTAGLCITIYYILTRYFKKIALPFTGGR